MPETTPLIKAALNLRVGAGFDVYVRPLSTDAASEGEALAVIINGCKVTINNHAGRDVIYHTISALRKL